MAVQRLPGFRGRTYECEVLDGLLQKVRSGESAVVVLRGEAGIGKTALLRYVATQPSGFRLAEIAGIESERELSFAALHQLCAPLLYQLDAIPLPQQVALRIAFGLETGEAPDLFLVALAALSLLSEVAEERPLLCLVEDAQWLDRASGQVLGFIARRLLAESVAMIFAMRDSNAENALIGLPELQLGGLGNDDAHALLASVFPGRLDERVRDRIVDETRGNPLALLELPRGLGPAELAAGFALSDQGDLLSHIEERYLGRVRSLPVETQRLMLLAAADPVGDPDLLWDAASSLRIEASALTPAADEELLQIGTHVRFRHPLVRSAIYRAAPADDRREVHEALARVTDPHLDPDRRAWHRAQAASGADEEIAAELERSAASALARGGLAAGAAFLERSAELTVDPAVCAERMLSASQCNMGAGNFNTAYRLLTTLETAPLDESQRARLVLQHGDYVFATGNGVDAPELTLQAAEHVVRTDVRLARDIYLEALVQACSAGAFARGRGLQEAAEAARSAPAAPEPDPARDGLLDGMALLIAKDPRRASRSSKK